MHSFCPIVVSYSQLLHLTAFLFSANDKRFWIKSEIIEKYKKIDGKIEASVN